MMTSNKLFSGLTKETGYPHVILSGAKNPIQLGWDASFHSA
jgi:hypothetical protein